MKEPMFLEPIKELTYKYGEHGISAGVFSESDAESIRIAKALERTVKRINRLRRLRGGKAIGYSITALHYPKGSGIL